jgi:hypothetical protein
VTQDDPADAAVAMLVRRSHLLPPEDLPAAADQAVRLIGAKGCRIRLVARNQRGLVRLDAAVAGDGEPLSLDGTLAGRAYRTTEVVAAPDGSRLWLPLLDGTERLGVLELLVDGPAVAEAVHEAALAVAALVAELIVGKRQYTDTFERVRRALPMGVPAEMLWRQLPPMTFATGLGCDAACQRRTRCLPQRPPERARPARHRPCDRPDARRPVRRGELRDRGPGRARPARRDRPDAVCRTPGAPPGP